MGSCVGQPLQEALLCSNFAGYCDSLLIGMILLCVYVEPIYGSLNAKAKC